MRLARDCMLALTELERYCKRIVIASQKADLPAAVQDAAQVPS